MRHLDAELRELKDQILQMGGYVERALDEVIQALVKRDLERFKNVHELEAKINRSHILVDESCLNLLARQAPHAGDLRLILGVVKINADLERMGDQTVNIAFNGEHYINSGPLSVVPELEPMTQEVRVMVRDALDAFVRRDGSLAQKVLEHDDVVDAYKNQIFRDLIAEMKSNPSVIDPALNLLLIARNLERLGDHATNIAEDVIFISTGKDIRHGQNQEKEK